MKACEEDITRNNPVWSTEQTQQICECLNRFRWAKHSKSDISLLVEADEGQKLSAPDHLLKDDLRYIGICMDNFSARPEDFSDR